MAHPPEDDRSPSLVALTTRYNRLESVYRLTRTIAAAATEDEICRIAMEALQEAAPGRRASLLLFDHEGIVRFRAWHGISAQYRAAVEGHCPWRPEDLDAQPFVLADVRNDTGLAPFASLFASEHIRSLAFIPLQGRGGVLGKFMIYGEETGDPIGADMALACNIAELVAIVVERGRTKQQMLREHALFTGGPVVVIRWLPGPGWPVAHVTPNVRQFGYPAEDFLNGERMFRDLVHPDDIERIRREVQGHIASGTWSFEQRYRIRDAAGSWRQLYDRTTLGRDATGAVQYFDGYLLDITEQRKLEQALLQAQKMESVGRLAGGVAHDFNNLLTVILAAAEHAAGDAPPGSELAEAVDSIAEAAGRAATLTSQLLAFARKQVIAPRVLDLNALLTRTADLLARVIGERIALDIERADGPALVHMDQGQLQQILVNLALNARDAMPEGGRLTFSTLPLAHVPPAADRVELRVSDTGVGMSTETLEHLFEPFFTTKEIGKGTGLGLATCYGIVEQSGGHISVASEPGRGACFTIQLPRAAEAALEALATPPAPVAAGPRGPRATILLAEDEPLVREFTAASLRRGGFDVLSAPDGVQALSLAARHPGSIELLISDLVMPLMNGRELAERIRGLRPGIRVLYSTGYDPDSDPAMGGSSAEDRVLMKPFTASQLVAAVRSLLTEPVNTSARAT